MSKIEGNNARYEELLSTLENSDEGRQFLSEFLKRHQESTKPHLELVQTDSETDTQFVSIQKDNITSATRHFSDIAIDAQNKNNPVAMVMNEVAKSLQRSEINQKKADQISTELRKLASILHRTNLPNEAGSLIEFQADQIENLNQEQKKTDWQLAKALKILQILDEYVRKSAVQSG